LSAIFCFYVNQTGDDYNLGTQNSGIGAGIDLFITGTVEMPIYGTSTTVQCRFELKWTLHRELQKKERRC
jgi:hypothetical protein